MDLWEQDIAEANRIENEEDIIDDDDDTPPSPDYDSDGLPYPSPPTI